MWRHGERVQQDYKKHTIKMILGISQAQLAARVDSEPKSFGNQTIFSDRPCKSKIQNIDHTKNFNSADWVSDE